MVIAALITYPPLGQGFQGARAEFPPDCELYKEGWVNLAFRVSSDYSTLSAESNGIHLLIPLNGKKIPLAPSTTISKLIGWSVK